MNFELSAYLESQAYIPKLKFRFVPNSYIQVFQVQGIDIENVQSRERILQKTLRRGGLEIALEVGRHLVVWRASGYLRLIGIDLGVGEVCQRRW